MCSDEEQSEGEAGGDVEGSAIMQGQSAIFFAPLHFATSHYRVKLKSHGAGPEVPHRIFLHHKIAAACAQEVRASSCGFHGSLQDGLTRFVHGELCSIVPVFVLRARRDAYIDQVPASFN